ncbi:MAG: cobalamin-binding protein [Candidatus Omnitrophica bacterium]|nr:cobalamin-binding protein [Candidatus Omnitrophota bacterium]
MRIASLLPTATEMLYALGLGRSIVGRSQHCGHPPEVRKKPVVVESRIQRIAPRESQAIHEAVSKLRQQKVHQFVIDVQALKRLKPDLVVTQNLCSVCAASHTEVFPALSQIHPRPKTVTVSAQRFSEVFTDLKRLGEVTGREKKALKLIGGFEKRLTKIRETLAETNARPRLFCCEWLEPLIAAGHWIPEMVALAGGTDGLGTAGESSARPTWERVLSYDPEVILVMPCSYSIPQTLKEKRRLTERAGWKDLSAVKNGRVFAVDGAFFHHAGPRLVDGVELLAHLLHPKLFPNPKLRRHYRPLA